MFRRISLIAMTVFSLATSEAMAGRWDVAFDGGFMRVVLDLNTPMAIKVYEATPGGSSAIAENLTVIQLGNQIVLRGVITSGDFKVGLGGLHFTIGDHIYFFMPALEAYQPEQASIKRDIVLVMVNEAQQVWTRKVHPF
jgi:hypothetical protein